MKSCFCSVALGTLVAPPHLHPRVINEHTLTVDDVTDGGVRAHQNGSQVGRRGVPLELPQVGPPQAPILLHASRTTQPLFDGAVDPAFTGTLVSRLFASPCSSPPPPAAGSGSFSSVFRFLASPQEERRGGRHPGPNRQTHLGCLFSLFAFDCC